MNNALHDVVTGGAGFIGSHLVDKLLEQGKRVKVVDSLISGNKKNLAQHLSNPLFEFIEADICDVNVMKAVCKDADRVFHLAARADIVPSIENPMEYYHSNVNGTFATLEAARANQINKFLYVASSTCYGLPKVFPTPETAEISPQYPYALTKNLAEQMVSHWHNVYKLPTISLRFFNVYGPRSRTTGSYGAVFGVFLAQLLANEPLTIVGDGTQTRDFTYVSDVVDSMLCAAESQQVGKVYNVGSGREPVSINYLVKLLGANKIVHIPKRPGEPDITWADTTKIKNDLQWEAKVPIEIGVKKMLEHIDYWREAPVWTVDSIAKATSNWFKYLG